MSTESKLPIAVASCLLGCALSLNTTLAQASGAGAFLGGMVASRVLNNMSERTDAEEYAAYSQPRTVTRSHESTGSAESRIKQLDKLAAGGYITPAEYKKKKQAILDGI